MLEIKDSKQINRPEIYVAGIGGGGNNAVDRMISAGIDTVHYISVNTDYHVLSDCLAEKTIQIGRKTTNGFGAGTDPAVGEAAAKESEDEIKSALEGANMVVLTCGMGGGTGTGAIPVIAGICRTLGILTVAVVTMPFSFEGEPRRLVAEKGLETLRKNVDSLLIIPNDRLLTLSDKQFYLEDAFLIADNVLKYTIQAITNIIYNKGTINLDFNDINTLLRNTGDVFLGIGIAKDDQTLLDAIKQALTSPLLNTGIENAKRILFNTSGRILMSELNDAVSFIQGLVGTQCNIMWGTVTDEATKEENKRVVTIIATGLEAPGVEASGAKHETQKVTSQGSRFPEPVISTMIVRSPQKQAIGAAPEKTREERILKIPDFLLRRSN